MCVVIGSEPRVEPLLVQVQAIDRGARLREGSVEAVHDSGGVPVTERMGVHGQQMHGFPWAFAAHRRGIAAAAKTTLLTMVAVRVRVTAFAAASAPQVPALSSSARVTTAEVHGMSRSNCGSVPLP